MSYRFCWNYLLTNLYFWLNSIINFLFLSILANFDVSKIFQAPAVEKHGIFKDSTYVIRLRLPDKCEKSNKMNIFGLCVIVAILVSSTTQSDVNEVHGIRTRNVARESSCRRRSRRRCCCYYRHNTWNPEHVQEENILRKKGLSSPFM